MSNNYERWHYFFAELERGTDHAVYSHAPSPGEDRAATPFGGYSSPVDGQARPR
jgi:hypothetical protein